VSLLQRPEAQLDRETISKTYRLIQPHIRRTPVLEVDAASLGLEGRPLVLKLELTQHTGSFKPRGAFSNLLLRQVPPAGVVAASGGNHGAAVAYAARQLGVPATIFVPSIASPAKIDRIRQYGARLIVTGERYTDALAESQAWQAASGALSVHAYDQTETLLGQGTIGLELDTQAPGINTLMVAVGGGGLIGGLAVWHSGKLRLVGVEPEASPTLFRALEAGYPVDAEAGGIAADSLAPRRVGALMFPWAQRHVSQVVLVQDDDIRAAQRALWRSARIVAEPGGAAALAALLTGRYRPGPTERVAVLICGGNSTAVDFDR
jgi:threonine dehydratase